ncbi:hypothetical protein evm_002377 [Chilo suppressalis]|nr:hypothetical protein evm_002377 [Chilo suppressalis]
MLSFGVVIRHRGNAWTTRLGRAAGLFPRGAAGGVPVGRAVPGGRASAAVTLRASRARPATATPYALHARRAAACGLDPNTIDLLPSPGAGNEWVKSLKPDSGREGEQMFEFDGETSATVPESVSPHGLPDTFSVTAWLRHAPAPDNDKHTKEHLLCLADDHKMNRHHYAVFVRNCRLILLLRRDFDNGDLNVFRPAEWRWKIPEVCDNEWHHYALNVRFPNVELFIDGEPYRSPDGKGPEVIDDWPLHPAHGVNTTLVVGACWQGTESDMRHGLRGGMAGLGLLRGAVQSHHALACLARCREGLSLAPDLYLRSVSVEGDGVADVETLLRRVSYGDARAFPTVGRRNVHLDTTITCDNGVVLKARPVEAYVMVLAPQTPGVLLSGQTDAARDYAHFRAGLKVFPDLTVRMADPRRPATEMENQKLDSCVVSVYPALNPDHEALSIAGAALLPTRYDIRAAVTRDGVSLSGADSVANYQKVLREIEYSNKKPAYYLNRVFKLTCSELNGRFTSNEYVQTLTVVHPHMSSDTLSRELHPSGVADKLDNVARDNQVGHSHPHEGRAMSPRAYAAHQQRDSHTADQPQPRLIHLHNDREADNHVALVIGVISCGAVVALIAAGAARARRSSRGRLPHEGHASTRVQRDQDMAWDDSALTITVNPMEETGGSCARHAAVADSSDGESCTDSDDDHDDDSDADEHVMRGKQHKYRNISQLEWDNSTM